MAHDNEKLFVKSHVGRDLLQTAGLFADVAKAAWEYIANSLQYVDPGTQPRVEVVAKSAPKPFIRVSDFGRGMDWQGLKNYFIMHAENQDRIQGKPGRGRFGTGKSAAFGIANRLKVTTRRDGKKSIVSLTRHDIEHISSGDNIPVEVIAREQPTNEPNGTVVEIEDVHFHVNETRIRNHAKRQLAEWPGAQVLINGKECTAEKPPVAKSYSFEPNEEARKALGKVKLIVNVAERFLEPHERGITIYSRGVLHEVKQVQQDNYLFGEIDVPRIEDDDSPIPPFDASRSLKLNAHNELVKALHKFIDQHVKEIREERARENQEKQATEEARKLEEHANQIARVLNEDFTKVGRNIPRIEADSPGQHDLREAEEAGSRVAGKAEGAEVGGTEYRAPPRTVPEAGPKGHGEECDPKSFVGARPPGFATPCNVLQPLGGFEVKYENMGQDAGRSKYLQQDRSILINLGHPQLEAARGGGTVSSPAFRRLAVEVAFSEYAMALAFELAQREGNFHELTDPIDAIRETLNRVALAGARLYTG
jgi:hypothetical protein